MSDNNYLHVASNIATTSDPNTNYDEYEKDKVSSSKSIQKTVGIYIKTLAIFFIFFICQIKIVSTNCYILRFKSVA